MNKLREFLSIYRIYALHHPRRHALRIAYGCAFRGLPF